MFKNLHQSALWVHHIFIQIYSAFLSRMDMKQPSHWYVHKWLTFTATPNTIDSHFFCYSSCTVIEYVHYLTPINIFTVLFPVICPRWYWCYSSAYFPAFRYIEIKTTNLSASQFVSMQSHHLRLASFVQSKFQTLNAVILQSQMT